MSDSKAEMAKKKETIAQQMKKWGESSSRIFICTHNPLRERNKILKCEKCGFEMIIKNPQSNIAELDDAVIDGQIAESNNEEENGDLGELWATELIYECEKCGNIVVAVQG